MTKENLKTNDQALKILITNTGAQGDLGLSIGLWYIDNPTAPFVPVFGPSDYIVPGDEKAYDNTTYITTRNIPLNTNLKACFSTYLGGPTGQLPDIINFGAMNTVHIMIRIDSNSNVFSEVKMYNS